MITAADADASPEICARRGAFPSPDEVVNGVEADQSHDDQIDRHDEAQQPRHDQDQDAGEETHTRIVLSLPSPPCRRASMNDSPHFEPVFPSHAIERCGASTAA